MVRSDHKVLCGIEKRAFSEVTNSRVLKLMEMCSVYSFSVEHIQGKLNTVAGLSVTHALVVWGGGRATGTRYGQAGKEHNI